MKQWLILWMGLLVSGLSSADELEPFTSDGCSSFPDGTLNHKALWLNCCIKHDLAYWKGGSYDERLQADKDLKACVDQVGEPEIAQIMLAGVRVGGSPYFPTSYRWGYGWPYLRGYQALSADDKRQVQKRLDNLRTMLDVLSKQIDK